MLSIAIKGTKAVIKAIENDSKQMRYAAWIAMKRTAALAKKDVDKELKRAFKNPTPFIKKSLRTTIGASKMVRPYRVGDKTKPTKFDRNAKGPIVATVGFKDVWHQCALHGIT